MTECKFDFCRTILRVADTKESPSSEKERETRKWINMGVLVLFEAEGGEVVSPGLNLLFHQTLSKSVQIEFSSGFLRVSAE